MKYLPIEIWDQHNFADFRPRFFVETYREKLSMYTPHFYQSRLMSVFSSCTEALSYVVEYRNNDKNRDYILSSLDEIEQCWTDDFVAASQFAHMDAARKSVFTKIRSGNFSLLQLNRLTVICNAVIRSESEYTERLLTALELAITAPCDLTKLDRITAEIYKLTGIYITHLLERGYSPTYLYNRSEMFIRPNNYGGRSFLEQFKFITERLKSQRIPCRVYFGIQASNPDLFLKVTDDPGFSFMADVPEFIKNSDREKLEKGLQINVVAESIVDSTDYVSAAWHVKQKLDKLLDAITALDVNPRIRTSSHCVVKFQSQQYTHIKALGIDLLISFLTSEGGTHFTASVGSIRQTLATLSEEGKEHLGRSLRYLRLARESVSPELKLLNLWIALESIFSDQDSNILANITEFVPQIYAISALKRRVAFLRTLLIANDADAPPAVAKLLGLSSPRFDVTVSESQIFSLLRNEAAAIDVFHALAEKEHLKFKLLAAFRELGQDSAILQKIARSEIDVARQLRRLYFLRNKIAHTGYYKNIRPQLITHLLDYVAVSYAALSLSAASTKKGCAHSIGDLLAGYKMGADMVRANLERSQTISKLEDLIPTPIL